MNTIIRPATKNDAKAVAKFAYDLAISEKKKPEEIFLNEEKILAHGFSENPYFHLIVAEQAQQVVGFALYFFAYAASLGARILYLEDLFVAESHRKNHIGTALLKHLADIAKKENCHRLQWQVYDWNSPAIQFYESLGAKLKQDLIQVRWEAKN